MKAALIEIDGTDSWQLEHDGFKILGEVLPLEKCDALAHELSDLYENRKSLVKSRRGGVRNLLRENEMVFAFASSSEILRVLKSAATADFFPVRALFFDKTPDANWLVPWHQDLTIAVAKKIETAGFSAWSVKEGIDHVQPPIEILKSMVTLRLHLDDCRAENGALKVVRGSHLYGRITAEEIEHANRDSINCESVKGDALLMRPLLLHASSPAARPSHRRVLHIEYASNSLPNGLEWFDRGLI